MSNNAILTQQDGKILWLWFNRPDAMNSINQELADEFCQEMEQAGKNPDVNVIIISGKGKAFCAGGDLKAIKALADKTEAYDFVKKAGHMAEAICSCPKPVLAMVNGVAAGAGFNIALACDLILAADSADFIQSFTNVGLIPDCGGHFFLPKAIGRYWAKEIMFEASPIGAFEGLEIGFVNKVFSKDQLLREVTEYAKELAEKPPLALSACKRLINESYNLSLDQILEQEAKIQSKLIMSADAQEGLDAFMEKRQPTFTGK